MKKTKLFKSLLVAAGLLVGASAWAGDEWSIDLATIGNSLADKTYMKISNEVVKISDTSMGTCTAGENALNGNFVLQTGTNWMFRTGSQGLYQYNSGGRSMGMLNCTAGQIITIVGTGNPNPVTNVTLKSQNGNTYTYTVNADGNVKFTPARYLYFTSVSVENPSATDVDYTVKYVDQDNNELKDAATYSGEPGSPASLSDTDKAPIHANDKKYVYASDDSEGKTIASDGSTVVTVTFREATSYAYSVTDNFGTELASGSAYEGDNVNFYVPYFVFKDGRFYQGAALSSGSLSYAQGTISNISADTEITVTYTEEEENTNVVFYSEAENLTGVTAYEDGFTNIRMSNGKAGYYSESTPFVTLPAGIYTLQASSRSGTTKFYAGAVGEGKEIGEIASTGAVEVSVSLAFLLTEDTPIYASTGDKNTYFDYVIIRKTGDYYETMSIVGDFSEGGFDDLTKGIAMTRDADNPYVWTAVVKDFIITSSKYSYNYKAVANQDYSVYELPSGYNTYQNYGFDYDGAREGKYTLTFTANTSTHSVELAIEKQKTATIYFINTGDWEANNIKVYVWNASGDNGWPGETMTPINEQIDGKDVYAWSTYALDLPTQIIISNGGSDTERTGNQPFVNGATYKADGSSTETKTITAAGYATFCSSRPVDFSSATGLTAYIAKKDEKDANKVVFTPVTKIPAETGVLLKGAAGSYTISSTWSEELDDVTDNALVGVTVDTQVAPGAFVLMNGGKGVGFYKTTKTFTVGANTAYIAALPEPQEGEARTFIGFDFDNTTTAIEGVATVKESNGEIYNLQGQRVSAATKGLYIVNGKKVLVK